LTDAYRLACASLEQAEAEGQRGNLFTLDARLVMTGVLFHNELDLAQVQLEAALALCQA